ncbi:MAG: hypothetical protein KF769_10690 [Parvibaculum sp.]|nr:hypothetical protein [Parvibaculum sp.]
MYALSLRRTHPRTAMTLALLAAMAMWVFAVTPAKAGYYPPAHSDAAYYYDSLAPYGTWTHHASYGAVWYPRGMAHGWRPYTHGRWVWDDGYGWTWASGFAWGWAPFHYGNWVWDAAFGWMWVPGRVWAPAWVTWRYSDSYVGWAPIGFGVSYWSYNPGWNYGGWSYVHRHHFGAPVVHQHIIVVNNYKTIYQNTRHWAPPRNKYNRVEHRGFDRGFVERGSRYKIDRVHAQPGHWQRNDHRAGTPQRNDWRDGRQATRNDGARQAMPERRIDGYVDGRRDPQWNGRQESQRQTSDQLRQRQLHEQQRRQQQAQPPQRQRETQERRPPPQQAQQQQRQQQLQEQQRRMQQAQPQQRQRETQERRPPQQAQQQQRQQQMQEQQRRPQQAQPPQRQRETQERRLAQQQPRAPQMQRQPEGRYEQRAERRDEGGGGRSWR